jgi:hypothetical protein
MIGKDGVHYLFRATCISSLLDNLSACNWRSVWFETSKEAKEAGQRHTPNYYNGYHIYIEDPKHHHVFSIERLAQNPQSGYGMDVHAGDLT